MREAGLETCAGGILNSGETREQRVEMAFELAAIDPTSPINLLNPRPGTGFGDHGNIDGWEAVKWIASFPLILPDALFRLCGGRTESLGDLQRLAVRAGRHHKQASVPPRPDQAANAWPDPDNTAGSPDRLGSFHRGLRSAA